MASNLDITLKRNNGTDNDVLFPTTHMGQIQVSTSDATSLSSHLSSTYVPLTQKGAANGVATLGSDSKIPATQLPSFVTGGMRFVSSVDLSAGTITLETLETVVEGASYQNATISDSNYKDFIGYYWVVSVGGTIEAVETGEGAIYNSGEEGDDGSYSTITLEPGDWIVLTGWEPTTDVSYFSIINNTYADAQTNGVKGVVTLSSASNTLAYNASTNTGGLTNGGTKVITENNLFDMMGTTSGTIARGDHTHGSIYQPLDSDLTGIADLVGSNSSTYLLRKTLGSTGTVTWSLDGTTYLVDSSTSTQTGYFGNILLKDDVSPSHYLTITAADNLTASRTLSLKTGDADRTLELGGNLTTSNANLSITAATGGSSLVLPTSLTIGTVGAGGILYGSANNTVGTISSTSIGRNLLSIPDITNVSFARFNADETITMRTAAEFLGDIGAQAAGSYQPLDGDLTSIAELTGTSGFLKKTADNTWALDTGIVHILWDTTTGAVSGDIIFDNDLT